MPTSNNICNTCEDYPFSPINKYECIWLVPLNKLPSLGDANRKHAYILPDNSVWTLNHEGDNFTKINGFLTIKRNGITLQIVNNAVNILVPEKLSELENDTGFITNTVSNLINYYNKTQIDNMFGELTLGIDVKVVSELPVSDISKSTIYFVHQPNGSYNEYMFIENEWELIGTTEVDLSNFYTKEEINKLMGKVKPLEVATYDFSLNYGKYPMILNEIVPLMVNDEMGLIEEYENGTILLLKSQDKLSYIGQIMERLEEGTYNVYLMSSSSTSQTWIDVAYTVTDDMPMFSVGDYVTGFDKSLGENVTTGSSNSYLTAFNRGDIVFGYVIDGNTYDITHEFIGTVISTDSDQSSLNIPTIKIVSLKETHSSSTNNSSPQNFKSHITTYGVGKQGVSFGSIIEEVEIALNSPTFTNLNEKSNVTEIQEGDSVFGDIWLFDSNASHQIAEGTVGLIVMNITSKTSDKIKCKAYVMNSALSEK